MTSPIFYDGEDQSNAARRTIARQEPLALRTYTPSQMVLARSSGVFHWTPENRRLYDYSSGVLVANLGHNPLRWMKRFAGYLGWNAELLSSRGIDATAADQFFSAVALTAYNAGTAIEAQAVQRLVRNVQSSPRSKFLHTMMWGASGSEAVQKALCA